MAEARVEKGGAEPSGSIVSAEERIVVVDTAILLQRSQLETLGREFWTTAEVIAEVRDKKTKQYVESFPFEMKVRAPTAAAMKAVVAFSKKTGDFPWLSVPDLKVMALVYDLEAQYNGIAHIRTEPMEPKFSKKSRADTDDKSKENVGEEEEGWERVEGKQMEAGSDNAGKERKASVETEATSSLESQTIESVEGESNSGGEVKKKKTRRGKASKLKQQQRRAEERAKAREEGQEDANMEEGEREMKEEEHINDHDRESVDEVQKSKDDEVPSGGGASVTEKARDGEEKEVEVLSSVSVGGEVSVEGEEEEDGEWITPDNIEDHKVAHLKEEADLRDEFKKRHICCVTGDFSMQNVLLQMGLELINPAGGKRIHCCKRFVRKCFTCYNIVRDPVKRFCEKCGNDTLIRVSYTVDSRGRVKYGHWRRPITKRGARYSIPEVKSGRGPKGGPKNPILSEDEYLRALGRQGRKREMEMNDPDFDFMALSKRAHQHNVVIGTGKRNPNESRKRTGKKKKANKSLGGV